MHCSENAYAITRMDHNGYVEPPVSTLEIYPAYIEKEVKQTVEQVQKLQGKNTFSFGFITDTHYAINLKATHQIRFRRTLNAYKEIAKRVHLDFLAMGGDHTNDGDKQYKCDCFRELRAELDGVRYFPVNGNHDSNVLWDTDFVPAPLSTNHLTPEENYPLFYNHVPAQGGVFNRNDHGLYYYYDNRAANVRYIFLDTGDVPFVCDNGKLRYDPQHLYALSQAQIDWLTDEALRLPEPNWTIVLFAHIAPIPRGEDIRHLEICHDILKAYQTGAVCTIEKGDGDFVQKVDVDFSSYNRGRIACMMLGHSHVDYSAQQDGIRYIETGCSIMYTGASYSIPRKDGDKSELLFDIVTVDPMKREIHLTRVGAAEDRYFSY